jgi:hypothetical protein
MTALHTSYGMLQDKLTEAGIQFVTHRNVTYTNSKEHTEIGRLEIYCSKLIQDRQIEAIKKALADNLNDIEISPVFNSIFIKIKK